MPRRSASWAELLELGQRILRRERDFNRRAGFTAAHDRLPAFMLREALPPNREVFDVPQADLDSFYDFDREGQLD